MKNKGQRSNLFTWISSTLPTVLTVGLSTILSTILSTGRLCKLLPVLVFFLLAPPLLAELTDDADELKDAAPGKKPGAPALQQVDDEKPQPPPAATSPAKKPAAKEGKSHSKTSPKPGTSGVVKFWSKSLTGFRDQGSLMLEEDVVVTQDDIHLDADKATIFFEKGGNEVTEVHAVGNVKFSRKDPDTGEPIKAEGQEAVFDNAKRTVVMKGKPVLYRGTDVVRGKAIHYDLTNGWIKADRVEGVVQPAAKKAGAK
jgi:lipopolysaccharide transport protein LptA